ncbi:hypothetical protein VIBNIWn13_130012 [Vibrio nigripulchritudo Wn13]|nr:hypothetical protein VIBNIENn2_850012 [Vibrio nigripulchritudo ENn2]CCO51563.1 hypothetical protein VIBNIWn13_130012 [Vibrio nigripulchritudo Wn13]
MSGDVEGIRVLRMASSKRLGCAPALLMESNSHESNGIYALWGHRCIAFLRS